MKIWLKVEDGESETVEVLPLGDGRFELIETPLFLYPDTACGDIVRLRPVEGDTYEIVETLERPYGHCDFLVPGEFGVSQSLRDFGEWIESRGGRWECVMYGMLFVHLPSGQAASEVEAELHARLERFHDSEERRQILESRWRVAGEPGPGASRSEFHVDLHEKKDPE